MRALAMVLLVVAIAMPAVANDLEGVNPMEQLSTDPAVHCPMWDGGRDVLYDNGPFETAPGLSVCQDVTLGSSTYGYGHQILNDNRLTDQFVVPAGETWMISAMTFFAYQTGSTTVSTITDVRVEIYPNPPEGGNLIWGDLVTNRLNTTAWTGVYRVLESAQTSTARPIMADVCDVTVTLGPGEYWVVWQCGGTLSSGPWAPPITIPGQASTGDALQWTTTNLAWLPASDAGDGGFKGFPFIIEGSIPTPVEDSSWGAIKALYQ